MTKHKHKWAWVDFFTGKRIKKFKRYAHGNCKCGAAAIDIAPGTFIIEPPTP